VCVCESHTHTHTHTQLAQSIFKPGKDLVMFMTHTHTHTLTLTLTLTHTQLAQSIFKPGKDLVMFMTVVSSSLAVPSGKELLAKYMDATRATCVEAVAEVKVCVCLHSGMLHAPRVWWRLWRRLRCVCACTLECCTHHMCGGGCGRS